MKEDVEKSLEAKEETIIEVELTAVQKSYYRAILEKNFSYLHRGGSVGKGSHLPSLRNVMMELRKCCNHPYLIKNVEKTLLEERKAQVYDDMVASLVETSGKLQLLDKLLPKLKEQGHRVLVFSQMTSMLDILEDYLTYRRYTYERIDGGVKGTDRQAAIDRYSRQGSDRFVFLISTKAGGVGINLPTRSSSTTAIGTLRTMSRPRPDVTALVRPRRFRFTAFCLPRRMRSKCSRRRLRN